MGGNINEFSSLTAYNPVSAESDTYLVLVFALPFFFLRHSLLIAFSKSIRLQGLEETPCSSTAGWEALLGTTARTRRGGAFPAMVQRGVWTGARGAHCTHTPYAKGQHLLPTGKEIQIGQLYYFP